MRFKPSLATIFMLLTILSSAVAEDETQTCPELNGKRIQVSGVVHSFVRYQMESQASPRTQFELINPDWQCKQPEVFVFASDRILCFEGQSAMVEGIYHGSAGLLSFFSSIEADRVVCHSTH